MEETWLRTLRRKSKSPGCAGGANTSEGYCGWGKTTLGQKLLRVCGPWATHARRKKQEATDKNKDWRVERNHHFLWITLPSPESSRKSVSLIREDHLQAVEYPKFTASLSSAVMISFLLQRPLDYFELFPLVISTLASHLNITYK